MVPVKTTTMDGIEAGGSKPAVSQVKYSKDFEIPADFPEILRDLTREILRANPTDINKFGT